MRDNSAVLRRRIRAVLALFMLALVASGLTAFPLQAEIDLAARVLGIPPGATPDAYSGLHRWVAILRDGIQKTNTQYPFLAYGTDWLAFAHLVIAVAFIGPLRDPVRNVWVIEFGMIACVAVLPLALVCGPIRGIPFYHQLLDCSFGVFGFIPLWFCRRWAREMEGLHE